MEKISTKNRDNLVNLLKGYYNSDYDNNTLTNVVYNLIQDSIKILKLDDKMKIYEKTMNPYINTNLPIIIRLDGKNFSQFTKKFNKPFDERLTKLMNDTTKYMLDYVDSAKIAYHQSDEITLFIPPTSNDIKWGGRLNKMVFDYATGCSNYFNYYLKESGLPNKEGFNFRQFDCRIFNVPDIGEAFEHFTWRQQDARRNSIQMMAQSMFSQKKLEKKSDKTMLEMCSVLGVNWDDYPESFKLGSYYVKIKEARKFTTDEIQKLPLLHKARKNPDLMVERNTIKNVGVSEFWNIYKDLFYN